MKILLFIVGMFAGFALLAFWARHRHFWRSGTPYAKPLIYVDQRMGIRPTILGNKVPDGYRLACLWFGSGLIDRTGVLDHGFDAKILDRIPSPEPVRSFAELCDHQATRIVSEAIRTDRKIHLFWSGGIDSTTACVAILKALKEDTERLIVFMSGESRKEYPWFYKKRLRWKIKTKKFKHVHEGFEGNAILVTGELGDQIFGSAKAIDRDWTNLRAPWEEGLYDALRKDLASEARAQQVLDYLTPQIKGAPVPITSTFDCLWWINFSMKWQPVSLRMLVGHKAYPLPDLQARTVHFFQHSDFQRWAMTNPDKRIRDDDWATYKWPARDYITAETGDTSYAEEKLKEPSLRGRMKRDVTAAALAIGAGYEMLWQPIDKSLKEPLAIDGGNGDLSFSYEREASLWDDIGDAE